ncbi:squalene synthase HpnC [Frankia sp. CNm7]|uniref:Squalene synthase HpnC n=1 Tax=Frankia nepalensis TaxID=1836974 RepID=A0A937USP3_9ACTN|nr:squalene synthase HpnC [Frankia nepalensis]MBL7497253.1 squalene synthase HpnC [Frankia nepalensis]MBL7515341.1 squalene synthase HpnC [Frankia nepalensis]MBL7522389.1 squalene synthase HpnC [Frankia nepalensis]MBL7632323.1 squalene synthase HpnC [Frankia nepalensis]
MTTIDARTSGSRPRDDGEPAGASGETAVAVARPRPGGGRAEPAGVTDIATSTDEVLRAAHGENFPVSPAVLPAAIREDFQAIYGFARLVDDIGDEAPGDRLALLDQLAADLERIWLDEPQLPVFQRLARTVRARELPMEPFARLIEANRLDQRVTRYATFDDLLRYCTLSADPIGRMVLGVLGKATPDRVILSDRVCTALQLAEHLQDVAEDYANGRIYLPLEDMDTFGVTEADLAAPTASPALRNLMAFQVARATTILDQGAPLASLLEGRMRLAIAGFVGGGRAALHAVRQAGYDVLGGAPKASKQRVAAASLWVAARSHAPSARAAAAAAGGLSPLCEQPPPTPDPTPPSSTPPSTPPSVDTGTEVPAPDVAVATTAAATAVATGAATAPPAGARDAGDDVARAGQTAEGEAR